MKVLASTSAFGTSDEALELLEKEGIKLILNPYKRKMNEDEIKKQLFDIDGLLAGLETLNEDILSNSQKLKAIARVGIGMSNVDIEAARKLNIKVSNTPDGPTEAVAEATMAAMLSILRDFNEFNNDTHNGFWNKRNTIGLSGTNVLIIGYGRIGQKVHSMLKPFGANVRICDPYVQTPYSVSLEQGLKEAQIITLHASGEDIILSKKEFSLIKPGVVILNPARGNLIDEKELIKALDLGIVKGIWLDSFWEEPYKGDLLNYRQALLTPHISTYTMQCRESMELTAVKNLIRDLKG